MNFPSQTNSHKACKQLWMARPLQVDELELWICGSRVICQPYCIFTLWMLGGILVLVPLHTTRVRLYWAWKNQLCSKSSTNSLKTILSLKLCNQLHLVYTSIFFCLTDFPRLFYFSTQYIAIIIRKMMCHMRYSMIFRLKFNPAFTDWCSDSSKRLILIFVAWWSWGLSASFGMNALQVVEMLTRYFVRLTHPALEWLQLWHRSRWYSRCAPASAGSPLNSMGFRLQSLGGSVVESEMRQRLEGLQWVQPSSNPKLRIEFQHELMPLCLREYNINGFHEGWKGHCAKNGPAVWCWNNLEW